MSLPLESSTEEREIAVRSSVKVFKTDEEYVVLAGAKEFKEAQNLDAKGEKGDVELLRFSRTFVCRSTGERVEAALTFGRADGTGVANKAISTKAADPTPFQTDPPSEVIMHEAAGFDLVLTAQQAPESCGSMYWDPLLQTPSPVNTSLGASLGGTEVPLAINWLAIGLGIGGGVVVLLAGLAYYKVVRGRAKNQPVARKV